VDECETERGKPNRTEREEEEKKIEKVGTI
jgi:hypothetical protein